jgi:ubiquinone/menaquinone biosynthesis C-methylase UbiE
LIDAIAETLGFDDQQIDSFTITRGQHDVERPRAIVIIEAARITNEGKAATKRVRVQPGRKQ